MTDTENDRQEIRRVAEDNGWQHLSEGDTDLFNRGMYRIDVYYDGDTADTAVRIIRGTQYKSRVTNREAKRATFRAAKAAAIDWMLSYDSAYHTGLFDQRSDPQ
jgi:uncharacterized lipoprotein